MITQLKFFDMLLSVFGFKNNACITIEDDKRPSTAYNYDMGQGIIS